MPSGPLGGPRPFVDDEPDVVLDQDMSIKVDEDRFIEDPLAPSTELATFLETLNDSQPQVDIATAEIYLIEGANAFYKLIIPLTEPVIIFSHIEDAARTMQMEDMGRLELSDGGVKPAGLARDGVDYFMAREDLISSFGAQTIL